MTRCTCYAPGFVTIGAGRTPQGLPSAGAIHDFDPRYAARTTSGSVAMALTSRPRVIRAKRWKNLSIHQLRGECDVPACRTERSRSN